MSKYLFLMKYPESPQGRYIEDTAQKIEECFISDAILKELDSLDPWVELEVFEDANGNESNLFQCIDNSKIAQVEKKTINIFKHLVREIGVEDIAPEKIESTMVNFRSICNMHFLLRIKAEKYSADERVVVQLG